MWRRGNGFTSVTLECSHQGGGDVCDNFRPPFLLFLACNQRGSPQRSPDGVGTAEGERTNYGDRTCHPKSRRRRQAKEGGKERENKNTCGLTLFCGQRTDLTPLSHFRKVRGNKKILVDLSHSYSNRGSKSSGFSPPNFKVR